MLLFIFYFTYYSECGKCQKGYQHQINCNLAQAVSTVCSTIKGKVTHCEIYRPLCKVLETFWGISILCEQQVKFYVLKLSKRDFLLCFFLDNTIDLIFPIFSQEHLHLILIRTYCPHCISLKLIYKQNTKMQYIV